jgi:4-carboxymuconolactone decarboxylase
MAESENYKKGTEIRSKLMGPKYAEKMNQSVYDDPIMKKFGDYAREAVFGMLWHRPGLDLKTKTLICVISDTAQARWPSSPSTCAWRATRAGPRTSSAKR